jgi:hypothetical protein
LDDKSEEVELSVALKQKQRNRERLDKRKVNSFAEKSSKPTEKPGATLDQAAVRDSHFIALKIKKIFQKYLKQG